MRKTFEQIWDEAQEAGRKAANECFVQHVQAVDSYTGRRYDPFPICGFAWVNIKPATTKFARWLKEMDYAKHDSYAGGVTIWISEYNQSLDRKMAHANAMAKVLTENGFTAYANSRVD